MSDPCFVYKRMACLGMCLSRHFNPSSPRFVIIALPVSPVFIISLSLFNPLCVYCLVVVHCQSLCVTLCDCPVNTLSDSCLMRIVSFVAVCFFFSSSHQSVSSLHLFSCLSQGVLSSSPVLPPRGFLFTVLCHNKP